MTSSISSSSNTPAPESSAHAQGRDITRATLSCVVPAFNEHDNLGVLLPRLQAVLTQTGANWEVIVVDDGSGDDASSNNCCRNVCL